MAKVIVKIDPKTGIKSYEVEGVAGSKCTDLTNILTAGKNVLEERYTSEYCIPDLEQAYLDNHTEE